MDHKPITSISTPTRDTFVMCRNTQAAEIRAGLVRLTRYAAVLEVYNPYSILQLSEVLSDFKIYMGDRMVYSGRAVVSSLVNTGLLLVCEVSLDEAWLEVDLFSPVNQREKLQTEFAEFLREWQKVLSIGADFKVVVADMQAFLVDLRRWLEQLELGIRSEPSGDVSRIQREVIGELQGEMLPVVNSWFSRFDEVADKVEPNLRPIHRAFARRQLHPLLLCSPFVYRTYQKPLGYAGDYEMVNMILRDPFEGASLFAKVVNLCFLNNPPAQAHRNRIRELTRRLHDEVGRVAATGRTARIFNLGCGPAREVQNFVREDPLSDRAEFTLMDFEDESLRHTGKILAELKQQHGRLTVVTVVKKSVNQILKDGMRGKEGASVGGYDFVYCAGLFDYMSDRICKKLMNIFYQMVAPGGLLLATNVDSAKPFRHSMEYLLEWHLICRDRRQLLELIPEGAPPDCASVFTDTTGVNVFVEVRRPGHA